jgi:hypothetical protein
MPPHHGDEPGACGIQQRHPLFAEILRANVNVIRLQDSSAQIGGQGVHSSIGLLGIEAEVFVEEGANRRRLNRGRFMSRLFIKQIE